MSGPTEDRSGGREASRNEADDRGGRGWMFVDLVTALDDAMHEVAHAFPAVDHRSHLPAHPTDPELDRIDRALQTAASAELHTAFASWRERDEEFAEAVRRLKSFDARTSGPGVAYQTELERRLDDVRRRRVLVSEAATDLRRHVARELDAPRPPE
jgi:hypothetical protein